MTGFAPGTGRWEGVCNGAAENPAYTPYTKTVQEQSSDARCATDTRTKDREGEAEGSRDA